MISATRSEFLVALTCGRSLSWWGLTSELQAMQAEKDRCNQQLEENLFSWSFEVWGLGRLMVTDQDVANWTMLDTNSPDMSRHAGLKSLIVTSN